MKWVVQAVGSAFLALLIAWLTGFPHRTDAPPERAILAVKNLRWNEPTRLDDRFRVVVTWLEDDRSGDDTRTVAQAFSNIKGIAMQRSARVVSASGASDEWLSGMQKSSRAVFDDWNADLVVAGRVKRTGDVLSLWIVPKRGKGTVVPINPICRRNPSIPGLCRIASPTCARPFELSLPWSVRLSSAAWRCILRTLPCDSSLPP